MRTMILFLLVTVLSLQAFPQTKDTTLKTAVIRGRVTYSDCSPVELATVAISKTDGLTLLQATFTDTAGRFSLVGYVPDSCLIQVSAAGIQDSDIMFSIGLADTVQLPDIIVSLLSNQLEGVAVTAKRPLITQEADRIVYDLQADPQSEASSVLDMMRKVPYLSVDANDDLLLKGSSGYKVFINGRPSGLVANNPKEVLRSIPASTVKSIEVITSPPAKYDAEGLAGIINIIMIRQVYNGYKGSVNAYEKLPVGGPGAGCTVTSRLSDFGVSAIAGINRYDVPVTDGELSRITGPADPTRLLQETTSATTGQSGYAGLELSYEPDSLNLVSGQLNWSNSRVVGASAQSAALTGVNTQQQYMIDNHSCNGEGGMDAAINYQRGFKANKDQLLTFSYQYLKHESSLFNDIVISDEINYSSPDYHQYNTEYVTEHTAQVDYVQPVKNLTVEGGIKGIFRTNESEFQYRSLNATTGEYETDQARSNIFKNGQDVMAAYSSCNYQSAGWQFKAGVRVEETMMKLGFSHGVAPLRQQYLNVLPVIVVSRTFKDKSNLSFSYSGRIQRPSIAELNPFVDRSNPDFEFSGNPYLHPISSNAYQLSYLRSGKATLNVSLSCLYFKHVFSPFPSYNPSTNKTLTRYENYGRGRVLKTNISLNYPIAGKWNMALNSDIRHVAVYGDADSDAAENSGFCVYVYISGAYSFEKNWQVNADFTYKMGGILLPLGSTSGFTAWSFHVSKSFIQSKLTVAASISNPFTKYRYADETVTAPDFLETSRTQSYCRRFSFSLNYRFGKLKEEIKKNRKGIINDDTAN